MRMESNSSPQPKEQELSSLSACSVGVEGLSCQNINFYSFLGLYVRYSTYVHTENATKVIPKLHYNKNLKSAMLCKFLFLCLTHLILFSILSTTIFILLKTWLSSGTTCSFKVWMFHSWPSTAWKRIWLQNIELCISLQPSPTINDTLSHQFKQFPGKIWLLLSFASWCLIFPLPHSQKCIHFLTYHYSLKWIHSGSKSLLGMADHSSFNIRVSTEHLH